MPHVSSDKLDDRVEQKIYDNLINTIANTDAETTRGICDDLLTETEQEMLSKRLAIIMVFVEGASIYRVTKVLNVSPSTAERIRNDFQDDEFPTLENVFSDRNRRHDFWQALADIYRAALPGVYSWRWLDRVVDNQKN